MATFLSKINSSFNFGHRLRMCLFSKILILKEGAIGFIPELFLKQKLKYIYKLTGIVQPGKKENRRLDRGVQNYAWCGECG